MTRLYAEDRMIAESQDSLTIPAWKINMVVDEPWFNEIKYPSVSSVDYPPGSLHKSNRTNCCNCGAPIPRHGRCAYCGTENDRLYAEPELVTMHHGEPVKSEMNITSTGISLQIQSCATRDAQGRLHRRINYISDEP